MATTIDSVRILYYGVTGRFNVNMTAYAKVVDSVTGLPVTDGTTVLYGSLTSGTGASPPVPPAAFATSPGTIFGFTTLQTWAYFATPTPPNPLFQQWGALRVTGDTNSVVGEFFFSSADPNLGVPVGAFVTGSSALTGHPVAAHPGTVKVMLTFTIPTSADPLVPLRTTVRRRTPPGGFATIASLPEGQEYYIDAAVVSGTTYEYQVRHQPAVTLAAPGTEGVDFVTSNTVTARPRVGQQSWGVIAQY